MTVREACNQVSATPSTVTALRAEVIGTGVMSGAPGAGFCVDTGCGFSLG